MTHHHPRIAFTGQGRWCSLLSAGLRQYANLDAECRPLDRVADAFHLTTWIALIKADVLVRVGFRPGARTWRGRGLDLALRVTRLLHPGQRTVYYWLGTDVQRTIADVSSGAAPAWLRTELARSVHLAGNTTLAEELAGAGVTARCTPHPFPNMPTEQPIPDFPEQFTVLTYVPDIRAEYYGRSAILEAASRLPDAHFLIIGGEGQTNPASGNVDYLGWRGDLPQLYAEASCVVRLVEHDGAGGTALEGCAWGRPVIYSRAQEGMIHVAFGDVDGLVRELEHLMGLHRIGELTPDITTAQHVRDMYAPERCYADIASTLLEIASVR